MKSIMSSAAWAISSSVSPEGAPVTHIEPTEAPEAVVNGSPPLTLLMMPLDSSRPGIMLKSPDGKGNRAEDLAFWQ